MAQDPGQLRAFLILGGDKVWLRSKCTRKNKNLKPLPNFVGPFTIRQVDDNHTYLVKQNGKKVSRESESRVKAYFSRINVAGRAPWSERPNLQPTRQGMAGGRKRRQAEPLTNEEAPEGLWQRVTFTSLRPLSIPSQRYT